MERAEVCHFCTLTWDICLVTSKRLGQVVGQFSNAQEGNNVQEARNDAPVVGVEDPLVGNKEQPRIVHEADIVVHCKGYLGIVTGCQKDNSMDGSTSRKQKGKPCMDIGLAD
jgi:hypothetical protein